MKTLTNESQIYMFNTCLTFLAAVFSRGFGVLVFKAARRCFHGICWRRENTQYHISNTLLPLKGKHVTKHSSAHSISHRLHFFLPRSTPQQEMKAAVSPCRRPARAWRTSAQRPSSSATGPKARVTTLPTSTASGSPPSISRSTPSRPQRRSKPDSCCRASAAARCAWRTCEGLGPAVCRRLAIRVLNQKGGGGLK